MADADDPGLLAQLDLTEYEATALRELLTLGRTTAPDLAEATGIPKARIYGVLDTLADRGFVKEIPGRPKVYRAKPPAELVDRAVENRRQEFERARRAIERRREAFLAEFGPLYERASDDVRPAEELFHVVDVGEASERETRALYHGAEGRVQVLTKSFGYLDAVAPALRDALDRGVAVSAILLHPQRLSPENRDRQAGIVDRLSAEFPAVDLRFSEGPLPWRGTVADPEDGTGKAVLLVEQEEVPNHLRQAAVTETGSFVAGISRYFDLVRRHDSVPVE